LAPVDDFRPILNSGIPGTNQGRGDLGSLRLVRLDQAKGGTLGEAVRNGGGNVLLHAGVTLSPRYLKALADHGFGAVYVDDPLAPGIAVDDSLRWETRAQAFGAVRDVFARAAGDELGDLAGARRAVDGIIDDITRAAASVFALTALRASSEYTFTHSVNVCALSILVGLISGYDRTELRQLGIGALLLDVGKVACLEATEKPGALTESEWALMKRHPVEGYELLRKSPDVHLFSAHVAFQHHERADGSGYPRGIYGERILPFAAIAAVADVYDAMTADRPYRPASPPHEAMRWLQERAGAQFDKDAVRRLARRVAVYPAGTIVRLSSGELGAVQTQGVDPRQPTVRVVADARLKRVEPVSVDLAADEAGRSIADVLADWPARLRGAI
jgi:HD-GYP domain-containing protein (c-di-GMP phosphodiesterase class II)